MLTIYTYEIEVKFSYPQNAEDFVLGEWHHEINEPGKLRLNLDSLPADKSREVYIKLSLSTGQENTELPIKDSMIVKGEKNMLMEAMSKQVIRIVSSIEAEAAFKDHALVELFSQVETDDRAAEALKLEMEGRISAAGQLLNYTIAMNSSNIKPKLSEYNTGLSDRMEKGMDDLDRKRSHSDTCIRKQHRQRG